MHIYEETLQDIYEHTHALTMPLLSLYTSAIGLLDVSGVISSISEGIFESSGIFFKTSPWDCDKYVYQVV